MRRIVCISVLGLLCALHTFAEEEAETELTTLEQKASYAIGLDYGERIKRQPFEVT